jgi:hypothetical protein
MRDIDRLLNAAEKASRVIGEQRERIAALESQVERLEEEKRVLNTMVDTAEAQVERLRAALEKVRLCAAECVAHQGGWDESPQDSVMNAHDVYLWTNDALELP